jgi:hypothetical protein
MAGQAMASDNRCDVGERYVLMWLSPMKLNCGKLPKTRGRRDETDGRVDPELNAQT